jgi:hypothetical protein
MAKNVFKHFVGTVLQGTVYVVGGAVVLGVVVIPGVQKHLVHFIPEIVKEIEDWKEK